MFREIRRQGRTEVRQTSAESVVQTARDQPELPDAIRAHASAFHAQGVQVDGTTGFEVRR